jgi:hypothetical protein
LPARHALPARKGHPRCRLCTAPSPPGRPAQWFVLGGWVFDITAAQKAIRDAPRVTVSLPIAPWAGACGRDRDPGTIPLLFDDGPDLSPAFLTDLSFPSMARLRTAAAI